MLAGAETRHDDRTAANGERCGCDDGRLNGLFRRLRSVPETILTFRRPFGGRLFVCDETVAEISKKSARPLGHLSPWTQMTDETLPGGRSVHLYGLDRLNDMSSPSRFIYRTTWGLGRRASRRCCAERGGCRIMRSLAIGVERTATRRGWCCHCRRSFCTTRPIEFGLPVANKKSKRQLSLPSRPIKL